MADDLAHEIKNPLNSMVINIEVLRSRAKKGDVDGVNERASVLESEVHRLNKLIDGMLKLMRPEKSPAEDFYIDTLLDELGALVSIQAKLARHRFEHSSVGSTAAVRGRRESVRFALLNILGAEMDAVASEDSGAKMSGTCDGKRVTIRIEVDGGSAGQEGDAREKAIETALALISPGGGTVTVDSETDPQVRIVTLTLPQVRSA
jgi:signal transduction histidine kinase